MSAFLIGTSGYSYKHWKDIFYPKGLAQAKWLPFYAEHFNTVEINATFYRHFNRPVFEKWHDNTPDAFSFVLKGPKSITRDKRLNDVDEELARFFEAVTGLQDKLSAVIWQMPPSFKNSAATLATLQLFLASLPTSCRHAVEFRHKSWDTPEVATVLNQHGVAWVSADSKRYVSVTKVTGGFGYFRFHGPRELYASSYSDEEMSSWAESIKAAVGEGDAYIYFNNDFYGYALANARLLKSYLTS